MQVLSAGSGAGRGMQHGAANAQAAGKTGAFEPWNGLHRRMSVQFVVSGLVTSPAQTARKRRGLETWR